MVRLLQEGDPFQGLRVASCLTLGSELTEETHVLTKLETCWEGAPGWRAAGQGNPGEQLYRVAQSRALWRGD